MRDGRYAVVRAILRIVRELMPVRVPIKGTFLAGISFLLVLCLVPAAAARGDAVPPRPPPQSFIWVGDPGRTFTDDELRYIAENHAIVVFAKFHSGWNLAEHHANARRLKELNPDIRVFPYFSMTFRFTRDRFGADAFSREWLLHDEATGEPVPLVHASRTPDGGRRETVGGWFVDLAREEYRTWAFNVLQDWLAAAPYDGIAFDNAVPIATDPARRRSRLKAVSLSQQQVADWNDGLEKMLAGTRMLAGAGREIIYNGIVTPETRKDRNLPLLEHADIALNENFCIATKPGAGRQILSRREFAAEIALMQDVAARGKSILQKAKYRTDAAIAKLRVEKQQLAGFCYGAFLMGYTPGRHYFRFGRGYRATDDGLVENAREIALPLGAPLGPYSSVGRTWMRSFENGVVYVNPDARAVHTVKLPEELILMNGNTPAAAYSNAQAVTVAPRTALFFLKSARYVPQAPAIPAAVPEAALH
jgi:hypothetical protein